MSTRPCKAGDTSSDPPDSKRIRTMSTPRAVRMYQPDVNAGARLLHIPRLVLHILEFTMMEEEFETDLWKWLAQIRRVCRVFRDLTPELVPTKFVPTREEMARRGTLILPLMRSFPAAPWKTAKLVKISNWSDWDRSSCAALHTLLETPGSLPNLEELQLWPAHRGGVINTDILYAIARNHPRLSRLHLRVFQGGFRLGENVFRLGENVTPYEFGTFAQLLQRPLQALSLEGCRMTDVHVNAFFSRHNCSSLMELDLGRNPFVSNSALNTISQQCSNLVRLSLSLSEITTSGLEVMLRANRGIRHLDVTSCENLSSESINVLVQHAPQLETLDICHCDWFTNECLDRLVQGQIDHLDRFDRQEIPLRTINARYSGVSDAGINRVKLKPNVSPLMTVEF